MAPDAPAPWLATLRATQERIASQEPHPYYLSTYRQAELSYWSHIPRWIAADIAAQRPERCLDIGCAYGTLLLYVKSLAGCAAYGIDFTDVYLSPDLIRTEQIHFAVCNIELDPLPWEGRYDCILFTEVLEHLNFHPLPTLIKIRRLLADGGRLYLSTPDAASWGRTTRYYPSYQAMPQPDPSLRGQIVDDHIWQFDRAELLDLVAQAGLRVARLDLSDSAYRHFNLTLTAAD